MTSSLVKHWRKLSGCVHPSDQDIFSAYKHSFNLDYPPPAFIGDIENAPVVVLMLNGGYNEINTPAEFPDARACEDFRQMLYNPKPIDPEKVALYYSKLQISDEIRQGKAAIVNAVAYRSKKMRGVRDNEKLAELLPSINVHRTWLRSELMPQALLSDRLVIAHRYGLWNIRPIENLGKNVVFSTNWRSPYLAKEVLKRVRNWT